MIDDFAHHPTAVRETIDAVRGAYAGRRLWAIFEPRSNTSKRNIFEKEFAAALALADKTIVAGVYQPEKVPRRAALSVARRRRRNQPHWRRWAGADDCRLGGHRRACRAPAPRRATCC